MRSLAILFVAGCAFAQTVVINGNTSAATTSLQSGTQGVYLINEGSGTTVHDTSGNGRDCTLGTSGNAPTWIAAGLSFLGSSKQFVICPASAFNGAQTLEIWYNNRTALTLGATGAVISTDANNGTGLQLITATSSWGQPFDMYNSGNTKFMAAWDKVVGPSGVAVVLGGTGTQGMYINGHPASGYKLTTNGSYSSFVATTNAWFGSYKGNVGPAFSGEIYAVITRSSVASAATLAADNAYIVAQKLAPNGLSEVDHASTSQPLLVFDGDSIMEGGGVSNIFNQTSEFYASQQIGTGVDIYNISYGGSSITNLNGTNYPTRLQNLLRYRANPVRVVLWNGGTNDIIAGSSAATVQTNVTNYCSLIHGDGGLCVWQNIMPRGSFTTPQQTTATTVNTWALGQWTSSTGVFDAIVDVAGSPVMGSQTVAAGAFNATYFSDGTHPTQQGNQVVGPLEAWGAWQVTHPGEPFTIKIPVPYVVLNSLNAGTTSQLVSLLQLGPKQKVLGITERVVTAFTATSLSAASFTVGDSGGAATSYDGTGLSLVATGTRDTGTTTFVSASGIVQATFSSTGANLNALTAGEVDFEVAVVQQQ